MNLKEFNKRNRLRCESPSGFGHAIESWSLSDWTTAMTGEVGEAANIVKKLNRHRDGVAGNTGADTDAAYLHAALADELADIFIYLDLLASAANIDLGDSILSKFEKTNRKIGYVEKTC